MSETKRQLDYVILMVLTGFFIISLLAVYSGTGQYMEGQSFYFVQRQLIWYAISFAVMLAVAHMDYELLETFTLPLYIFGVILLIYVQYFGIERNGSQRWIDLSFMEFQPSELMKLFIVLYLSTLYKKYGKESLTFAKSSQLFLKTIIISALPFLLIVKQPDLGSAILISVTVCGLLLISAISKQMVFFIVSLVISALFTIGYLFIHHQEWIEQFFEPHQLGRIYSWLDPTAYASNYGYQLEQAMLGIGAGRLTGAGFNQGYQAQSGRVPEAHTDFIFAVIAEEFGFVGASILILLYFLLIYRMIMIALKATNLFGVYLSAGITILFAFQVFQNIAMTIGLMPVTGITLPFISYGGSALLTSMAAMGLIQSVHLQSKDFIFSSEDE